MNRLSHVVVIGSTGFLGRQLELRLKLAGTRVTGLSRARGFDVLKHDLPLRDVDHVYHLAGMTYVPDAWSDPAPFYEANAHATVRVLDQCRRGGVPLTYTSAYVYGRPATLPISESAPAQPNNPYAFSKFAGEEACRFFAATWDVPVSILRPFNVYGPGQDKRFLIPTIAAQVLDPQVSEIVVADLDPRRDFVFVDDVIDALVCAPGLPAGQPFNVGAGRSWSVGDVIATCLSCAGITKPYRSRGERRNQEIPDVVADITAIRQACGWHPKTDFTTGIAAVLASLNPC